MTDYKKYIDIGCKTHKEMILELIKWVEINTGTHNLIGLSKMMNVLKSAFSKLEANMEEIALPPHSIIDEEGKLKKQSLGHALYLSKREDAPIQIYLGGHYDTVFPSESSFQQAERLNSHLLRGPGTTDMKGGIMILLKSLEIFERSPFSKRVGWHVLLNPDEEIGSSGSSKLICKIAKKCQLGLIFEPCFSNGALINARKGSINFTLVAKGRSAHAGRDFHEGRNAISAIAHFIIRAEQLTNLDHGITLNVGNVRGGGALNIVPNLAICGFNVRMTNPEDVPLIQNTLQEIVSDLNNREGFVLSLHLNTLRKPKAFDIKNQELMESILSCGQMLDIEIQTLPSGGVTDGNLLFEAGIPSVDSLGALGGNIHTEEEFVDLNSLVEKTQLVSLFLMRIGSKDLIINRL